jgi:hypothetical protein
MYSTRYFFRILRKSEYSRQIFGKSSNIRFYQNPSSGSQLVSCGYMEGRRTDMMQLIIVFREFVKAPNKKFRTLDKG